MVDTPQTLAAAILRAIATTTVEVTAVVAKGALNVKNDARKNVEQSAPVNNAYAQNAITYDSPRLAGMVIEAEIGYDKERRGGSLGNLLEFGGGGDKSPPHRDLGRALDVEEPRFEAALYNLPGIAP
jgi:hypothetical protein